MLYWYVATYARANPELTLLTINLLTKDCSLSSSPDPAVRALALRALCGLRVRGLVEYAAPAVTQALKDPHPAVRRAAVVGVPVRLPLELKDKPGGREPPIKLKVIV